MLGLAWLTQMQKKDGSWVYDGSMPQETAAATGMSLLASLEPVSLPRREDTSSQSRQGSTGSSRKWI